VEQVAEHQLVHKSSVAKQLRRLMPYGGWALCPESGGPEFEEKAYGGHGLW
jgi:hypothetical protein